MVTDRKISRVSLSNERKCIEIKTRSITSGGVQRREGLEFNKRGGDGHTRGWTFPFLSFFVPKIFLLSMANNMATDRKIFRVSLSNERKRIEIKTRSITSGGV